jgi:hypothetical protein
MPNIKFLGIYLDKTLSWKSHIDKLVTKMSTACYAIRIVRGLMSQETLRMVYFAYVRTMLEYRIFSGVTHQPVLMFSDHKSGSLELLWMQELGTPVERPIQKSKNITHIFVIYIYIYTP